MSLLKVKPTVRPRCLAIAAGVINAANELGLQADMLITAGTDGAHMTGSKHYLGDALDIRTKHLAISEKESLRDRVRARLGNQYDVILEAVGHPNEHLHVEFDPD